MYLKPESCKGCPFYELSKYITPDHHVTDAEILLLAQAPGEHEELGREVVGEEWQNGKKVDVSKAIQPQPLIGRMAHWIKQEFWPLTKLNWRRVSKANVIKCRPYGKNGLPDIAAGKAVNGITVTDLKKAIDHCTKSYLKIPKTVKYIMALGEVALYGLSGEELLNYRRHQTTEIDGEQKERKSTVTEWRGWALEYDKTTRKITAGLLDYFDCRHTDSSKAIVFSVILPAALFESDKLYHATLCDFNRFGRLVRGEWPSPVPDIKINHIPEQIPSLIGFDTEYTRNSELIMWSMADIKGNIYVVDASYSRMLQNVPSSLTVVTQNGLVDLPHLLPILPNGVKLTLHDCMLGHALVWAGESTGLDYQLSKSGEHNRHKHLLVNVFDHSAASTELAYLYAGLDAMDTLNSAWRALRAEFHRDELVWQEYLQRRQPLLKIINRSQQKGIALDQERLSLVSTIYDEKYEVLQQRARELTGNPDFNIASDKMIWRAVYEGIFSTSEKATKRTKEISAAEKSNRVRKTARKKDIKSRLELLLKDAN